MVKINTSLKIIMKWKKQLRQSKNKFVEKDLLENDHRRKPALLLITALVLFVVFTVNVAFYSFSQAALLLWLVVRFFSLDWLDKRIWIIQVSKNYINPWTFQIFQVWITAEKYQAIIYWDVSQVLTCKSVNHLGRRMLFWMSGSEITADLQKESIDDLKISSLHQKAGRVERGTTGW